MTSTVLRWIGRCGEPQGEATPHLCRASRRVSCRCRGFSSCSWGTRRPFGSGMITGRGKADWLGFFLVSTHYPRIKGLWCGQLGMTRGFYLYPRSCPTSGWLSLSACRSLWRTDVYQRQCKTRGYGAALVSPVEPHTDYFGTRRIQRIRSSCRGAVWCGSDVSHEDEGVCLAPSTTTTDDEIPTATFGTECSSGMPAVRQGSRGLLALILRLPLSPNSVAGDRHRPPCGDLGGGILTVARRRKIPS